MIIKEYKKNPDIRRDIEPLFISAFPSDERPPAEIYFSSFDKDINKLYGFYDDKFVGFASLVLFKDIAYIFFLAVDDKCRNQGYGSKILSSLKEMYRDSVLLLCYEEVDERYPDNDIRKRREAFHKRNGFIDNELKTNEFGVVFQTAYIGKHKVPFEDYKEIFAIGFGKWTLSHLKKEK